MPYTDFARQVSVQGAAAACASGRYRYVAVNGEFGTTMYLYRFASAEDGLVMAPVSPQMQEQRVDATQFFQTGLNEFLVPTARGVYRYVHRGETPYISRITQAGLAAGWISRCDFDYDEPYVMAGSPDAYIYRSASGRVWRRFFAPASVPTTSVVPKNAREWYFATSAGLYKSVYMYKMVDDVMKFSESDMRRLYMDLLSSVVQPECEDIIVRHQESSDPLEGHLSSIVDKMNSDLLGVGFEGFRSADWYSSSGSAAGGDMSVSNDIVYEQVWGDENDWDFSLSVSNMFVETPNAPFTYMVRRWMSGLTELYVQVPTTNTYYINHVPSTPNYNIGAVKEDSLVAANVTQFGQAKTVFSHDPNQSFTKMSLRVSKSSASIDALLGVQACGNSLPLKIYKETVRENGDWEQAQYFNSYVAPTVMLGRSDDDDNYVFDFACFGSDEQVVRLEFVDETNRFDQKYYRVVFNSSSLDVGQKYVKQRIQADGGRYKLRRNQYRWPGGDLQFVGWTFTQYPAVDCDVDQLNGFWRDGDYITSGQIEACINGGEPLPPGSDATLYAVWETYGFGSGDTTLQLSPSPGVQTFGMTSVQDAVGKGVSIRFESRE